MTWNTPTKNTSTLKNILKHGSDTLLRDLADFKFTDVIFNDGVQLKDITFEELTEKVWNNVSRNSTGTFTNKSKS